MPTDPGKLRFVFFLSVKSCEASTDVPLCPHLCCLLPRSSIHLLHHQFSSYLYSSTPIKLQFCLPPIYHQLPFPSCALPSLPFLPPITNFSPSTDLRINFSSLFPTNTISRLYSDRSSHHRNNGSDRCWRNRRRCRPPSLSL